MINILLVKQSFIVEIAECINIYINITLYVNNHINCNTFRVCLLLQKSKYKNKKKISKIRLTEKLCHRYNLITVTIIIYPFIIIYHANLSINVPFSNS